MSRQLRKKTKPIKLAGHAFKPQKQAHGRYDAGCSCGWVYRCFRPRRRAQALHQIHVNVVQYGMSASVPEDQREKVERSER